MRSDAKTVRACLDGLPAERREALKALRTLILKRLPKGYEEVMAWGMITYPVPLASQKNPKAVHLCNVYASAPLQARVLAGFKKAGKKLEDLPLDVVGRAGGGAGRPCPALESAAAG